MPELRIGVTVYAPFFYRNADGQFTGVDLELAEEACARLNLRPAFVVLELGKRRAEIQFQKGARLAKIQIYFRQIHSDFGLHRFWQHVLRRHDVRLERDIFSGRCGSRRRTYKVRFYLLYEHDGYGQVYGR